MEGKGHAKRVLEESLLLRDRPRGDPDYFRNFAALLTCGTARSAKVRDRRDSIRSDLAIGSGHWARLVLIRLPKRDLGTAVIEQTDSGVIVLEDPVGLEFPRHVFR